MNELIKKAEELATLLKTSKEYLLAKETEEIQKNDAKAQPCFKDWNLSHKFPSVSKYKSV